MRGVLKMGGHKYVPRPRAVVVVQVYQGKNSEFQPGDGPQNHAH